MMNYKSEDPMRVTGSTRQAGLVKRYHTWPTTRTQTVAEHCWQVMRIYLELFGRPSAEVWEYILHHDSTEVVTGDLPFPVKSQNEAVRLAIDRLEREARHALGLVEYSAEDYKHRVKICDLLEMLEFAVDELLSGSTWAEPIRCRIVDELVAKTRTVSASTKDIVGGKMERECRRLAEGRQQ